MTAFAPPIGLGKNTAGSFAHADAPVTPPAVHDPLPPHPADAHPAVAHPAVAHPAVAHPAVAHPAAAHPAAAHGAAPKKGAAPAAPAVDQAKLIADMMAKINAANAQIMASIQKANAITAQSHAEDQAKLSQGYEITQSDIMLLGQTSTSPYLRGLIEHRMKVARLVSNAHDDFDKVKVTNELEELSDPDERRKVLEDYKKATGQSLDKSIEKNTDDDDHFRVATDQLMSTEREVAERKMAKRSPEEAAAKHKWAAEQARKLGSELSKSDPDKKKIFDTLNFVKDSGDKSDDHAEDVEAIRQAYREIYPEEVMGGLMERIDKKMGGDNEKEALAGLDMSAQSRLKQAAAKMQNSFTGRFHDNDRERMKETLQELTPEEIASLKANPEQYGDIINKVDDTMHGADKQITESYIAGNKSLAEGQQIAENINGNVTHMAHAADCDKKSMKETFAAIQKLDPKDRAAAVKAYDEAVKKEDPDAQTLEDMVGKRWSDYDVDRGVALLHNDEAAARAAEAEDAIDRKGTHIDDLEEALSDPHLGDKYKNSKNPEDQKKYQEALKLRADVLKDVQKYNKGDLVTQAYDEDKLQVGKDNRVAFDNIMETGEVGFTVKLQRTIDDDDTEKGKELLLHASKEDLDKAHKEMPNLQHGKTLEASVREEWGPDHVDPYTGETIKGDDSDRSGTFIQMDEVLKYGSRENWTPEHRAKVDTQAHDADRGRMTMKEYAGEDMTGRVYDYDIAQENKSAARGDSKEAFAFHAENTEAAGNAYAEQREADTESFVAQLKMIVTIATLILAPEFAPLILPLMSAASIGIKESMLGKHYKGENADLKGLGVDMALSAAGVIGEGLIEARAAANIAKVGEELNDARALESGGAALADAGAESATVVERAGAGEVEGAVAESKGAATEMKNVEDAHKAADEASAAQKEMSAAHADAQEAKSAANKLEEAGAEGEGAGKDALSASEKAEEKIKKFEEAAEKHKGHLETGKIVAENVVRGKIEGKDWTDIAKGTVLNLAGVRAAKVAGNLVHGKLAGGGAEALEGGAAAEGKALAKGASAEGDAVAHAEGSVAAKAEGDVLAKGASAEGAAATKYEPGIGHHLAVGGAKATASLAFDLAANPDADIATTFVTNAASHAAGEHHAAKKAAAAHAGGGHSDEGHEAGHDDEHGATAPHATAAHAEPEELTVHPGAATPVHAAEPEPEVAAAPAHTPAVPEVEPETHAAATHAPVVEEPVAAPHHAPPEHEMTPDQKAVMDIAKEAKTPAEWQFVREMQALNGLPLTTPDRETLIAMGKGASAKDVPYVQQMARELDFNDPSRDHAAMHDMIDETKGMSPEAAAQARAELLKHSAALHDDARATDLSGNASGGVIDNVEEAGLKGIRQHLGTDEMTFIDSMKARGMDPEKVDALFQKLRGVDASASADGASHVDEKGNELANPHVALTPEEQQMWKEMMAARFEDIKVGETDMAKITTKGDATGYATDSSQYGDKSMHQVGGWVSMSAHTDGQTAPEQTQTAGLDSDWHHNKAKMYDKDTTKFHPNVAGDGQGNEGSLDVVQFKASQEIHDNLAIPMGDDARVMMQQEAARLQAGKAAAGENGRYEAIPALLNPTDGAAGPVQVDEHGLPVLHHINAQNRGEGELTPAPSAPGAENDTNPYTGWGFSAVRRATGDDGQVLPVVPNQELRMKQRTDLPAGSELTSVSSSGAVTPTAKLNGPGQAPDIITEDVAKLREFFDHMVGLQKTPWFQRPA